MTRGSYGFKDIFLADCKSCTVAITVDAYAAMLWYLTLVTTAQQMMLARVVILLYKSSYKSWQKIRSYDPVAVKTYTNHLTGPRLAPSVSRQWRNIEWSHISSENKVYFTKILRARTKTASLRTSCLCQTKRGHQWQKVKINVLKLMEDVLFSS